MARRQAEQSCAGRAPRNQSFLQLGLAVLGGRDLPGCERGVPDRGDVVGGRHGRGDERVGGVLDLARVVGAVWVGWEVLCEGRLEGEGGEADGRGGGCGRGGDSHLRTGVA